MSGDESSERQRALVREEFERAAAVFARRTQGRFDHLDVVAFSRVVQGATVLEVGAGTGNFLSVFSAVAGRLIAADLTPGMLRVARERNEAMLLVAADAFHLPVEAASVDLSTSAHAVHHIPDPLPVFREMARVAAPGGRILVVDITAPSNPEEAERMNEVMTLRDPSHASAFTTDALVDLVGGAGLRVIDRRVVDRTGLVSNWMWPGEFPAERIETVRAHVARHWREIGMGMQPHGDDFTYLDRRTMVLAEPGRPQTG